MKIILREFSTSQESLSDICLILLFFLIILAIFNFKAEYKL